MLLDRDGTLVVDVPYNDDPARVTPMPSARRALSRLRRAGLRLGVVTNQSGIGRGLVTEDQVDAVDETVRRMLGPFDVWMRCPHAPADGCACRKPEPGLVLAACAVLQILPDEAVVVGDIGADMGAARAAGAPGIIVPTPLTRPEEVAEADHVAPDLDAAATLILSGALARGGAS